MGADDLSIAGLVYLVTGREIQVAVVGRDGSQWIGLGDVSQVLGPIARLRDELARDTEVAVRRLPELTLFAAGWGRSLVPPAILADPPDVLVIVPHALLHGLPLHLVQAADGRALACCSGISYASSPTLLLRAAARKPARRADRAEWAEHRVAAGGGTDVLSHGDDQFRSIAADVLGEFGAAMSDSFFRADVRSALRNPGNRVACIISHGFVDPNAHADSGILIDPPMGVLTRHQRIGDETFTRTDLPMRDLPAGLAMARPAEVLTLGEIEMDDPTSVELTILLACSAGASDVLQGDEPASLAEALLRLGSVSVIAPMWACDHLLARAWIRHFLAAWQSRGMPKAMAAREAFLALGDGTDVTELGPIHLRGDWL
jgi:CHAT domain-containing protein